MGCDFLKINNCPKDKRLIDTTKEATRRPFDLPKSMQLAHNMLLKTYCLY